MKDSWGGDDVALQHDVGVLTGASLSLMGRQICPCCDNDDDDGDVVIQTVHYDGDVVTQTVHYDGCVVKQIVHRARGFYVGDWAPEEGQQTCAWTSPSGEPGRRIKC